VLSKDLLARKIYKVDIFVEEKFKRRHPVLATQVYIFTIRHATFINTRFNVAGKDIKNYLRDISGRVLESVFDSGMQHFYRYGLQFPGTRTGRREFIAFIENSVWNSWYISVLPYSPAAITSWACFNSNKFKKVGIIVRL